MARTCRVKLDKDAHYHLMSRINNKLHLLRDNKLKRQIVDRLKKIAIFTGIKLDAYCIMDNHFHIVCSVVKPEGEISENEVLKRIKVLKGERFAKKIAAEWEMYRSSGLESEVKRSKDNWVKKMYDISQMIKIFKETINVLYKRHYEHTGSLWEGRFRSTVVEDGKYLATCIKYVELNPVRAKMVRRAKEYEFSSHNVGMLAGSVPDVVERVIAEKKMPQITCGIVFGSFEYVAAMTHRGIGTRPRHVCEMMFSSHGHILAGVKVA